MNFLKDFQAQIKLFLVVASVAVIVAVGGIFLLKGAGPNQVSPTPAPIPQHTQQTPPPSPQLQATDTNEWQTYRNEEFRFEVKYPENFVITESDPSFVKRDGGVFGISISYKEMGSAALHISVIETNLSPLEWLDKHYTAIPPNYNDVYAGHYSAPQDITINGIPALRFSLLFTSGSLQSTVIQKEQNVLYHFAAESNSRGSFSQETYNQILSTFRFMEPRNPQIVAKVKNADYTHIVKGENIKLMNGEYFKQFAEGASGLWVQVYKDKIVTGDIDNDGDVDAAVILTMNQGGSGSFRFLFLLLNESSIMQEVTSKQLGDRVIIHSIKIQNGEIVLDMVVQGEGEDFQGMCCPNVPVTKKFKLEDDELVEI